MHRLESRPDQENFVAPNLYSLAQAKFNPLLTPLAVYDDSITGLVLGETDPMVSSVM